MTDPTGVSFISYKRERAAEARLLLEAKLDRGVQSWQDVSDLPHGTTETELEAVLQDPKIASAVLLASPEVEKSNVIRDTEAPLIFSRHTNNDGFFVVPIAAGGLGYGDVGRVLGPRVGLIDISGFNIKKAANNPFDETFATEVAKVVLDHRLSAISRKRAQTEPVLIQLSTRAPLPKEPGFALRLDLRHRFSGRQALPGAWEKHILPSFADVVSTLQVRMSGRQVIVSGYPAIPAATAFGAAFLTLTGVRAAWMQDQQPLGREPELWGLHIPEAPSGFEVETQPQAAGGTDLALLVSATTDVVDDFRRSASGLPLRAVVHVAPPKPRPARVELDPGEAHHVARLAVDALRDAWTKYGRRGTVHLFLAVPAGVAFMIGQQLNTFGPVQTYEHVPGGDPPYRPAALIEPSI